MAVRTYYGTCITEADESIKEVYVSDSDLAQGTFNFEEGDLLVVFFADTNTENEPSIVVYNKDTNQEVSTSDEVNKFADAINKAKTSTEMTEKNIQRNAEDLGH